ncbi:DUF2829 domain-containing protein [Niveibacterium terrae]|uniref:DUF2829 domain-containing protein n=1 Tax=Niveibacterium terrae TaxID=3373598 RepID=UPI003A92FBDB
MTKKYIGTKEILAWGQEKDGKPGYAVKYPDGYISWSPKDVFEAAYRKCEGTGQHLTFGDAIHFLGQGKKVARAGWDGKGMFLFLVPGSTFKVNRPPLLGIYPEGTDINYRPHIDLKGIDGSISTWNPTCNDVLAEDWLIVE